jgi:Xaa-Pro aminopeptidase
MDAARDFIKRLKYSNLDGFIVSSPKNLSYLTRFDNPDAYALVSSKGLTYFTDSRYAESCKDKLKGGFSVRITNGSIFTSIAKYCIDSGLKRIGFEERQLPYAEYKKIKEYFKAKALLVPTYAVIEGLREIKRPEEIVKIKQALKITASAIGFIKDFIRPGIKEIELAAELERFIRYRGAKGSAFDIIVGCGANSAYPHHFPTAKKLVDNSSVLIDLGVDYLGYKSDLTRVFFLGKINSLYRRIYAIVVKAQDIAIKKIKPGEKASVIDAASRKYIENKGYGKNFVHSLGHGVGLDIHEMPNIGANSQEVLKEGMVFTVEPAIYLPGKFGVRIEDMVLVTKRGCEVLSGTINK